MLEQVFVNLMTNAIYAIKQKGPEKGRLVVTTQRRGPHIEIQVSDNGVGIPREDQERMFELFYTTKPPRKGTGLGLPICQNIIRKLGGDLTFESQLGEGTSFTVHLPVE
jgi:signal transduction histidine kinase